MVIRPPPSELDVERLRRGRPDAVSAWFDAYADPLYTFVLSRVGRNADLAAEITQETFVTALARIRDFDPERGEMLPWLTYMARNAIRKALRHQSRNRPLLEPWRQLDRPTAAALADLEAAPLPDEIVEREETAEMVRSALSTLSARHQRALRQRYFLQLSVREMAEHEGVSEGAVRVLLHRARRAFQGAFEDLALEIAKPESGREHR
jgi:RNA polymerase sigma-70 factor (ECF subfamily)